MSLKLEERDEELPESWQRKSVAEICEFGGGSTPRKSREEFWGGNVLWVSPKDFEGVAISDSEDKLTEKALEESSITVYEPGAIAIVVRSGVLKHSLPIARLERPATVNQDIKVLKPDTSVIREDFLLNLLRYEADRIRTSCAKTGTTVESLETSFLESYRLPIPPLSEQRRIAAILSTVDEEIRQTDKIIDLTNRIRDGVSRDLLSNGINHTEFCETARGTYPRAWQFVRGRELTSLRNGKHLKSDERLESGSIPVYGGNGIMGYYEDSLVDEGAIVVGRVGQYCGNIHITESEAWVTDNAIVVQVTSDDVNNRYFAEVLDQANLKRFASQSAQPRISQSVIESLEIPVPPVSEQNQIASVLTALEDKTSLETKWKQKLTELKRGLMQDLLTGKTRVDDLDPERVP